MFGHASYAEIREAFAEAEATGNSIRIRVERIRGYGPREHMVAFVARTSKGTWLTYDFTPAAVMRRLRMAFEELH